MSAEFPFLGTVQALNTATLPLFKMYAWENDNFVRDEYGDMILLEGNDALKVWIIKCLRTERFAYLAYSWRYGSQIKEYIGKVMSVGERKSELKRAITEALMVNPYILAVDNIEFVETEHLRDMQIKISLTTVYGTMTL